MKSGILYERKSRKKRGEVDIGQIVGKLKRMAFSLRWAGAFLIGLSLLGLGYVFEPMITAQISYRLNPPVIENQIPSKFGFLVEDWPNWEVPDNEYSLFIPKIGARARVVGDVDAADEQAYLDALKQGVAAAAGLSYPGQIGTTYLFAHSTDSPFNFARYNAIFYLLDKMEVGDRVEVVYGGKLYKYAAQSREILEPDDVALLTPQTGEEILVLQTCYPPGTTWKRLVVVAKRI